MESAVDKLQKRTGQIEGTEQINTNTESPMMEQSSWQPQSVREQVGPNSYEERFHSEFCFISLVLGIFGLILPLFSPLAIIFGVGGLMQTHREHMKGKGMAVAGIILGFLGIILIVIAIVFSIGFLENYLLRFGELETLIGKIGEVSKFVN